MNGGKIKQDHSRFRQILRGKIKQNFKKYITHTELIGKRGKNIVSIPVPRIDLPRFRFDPRQVGGVGQGEGEIGTVLGPGFPLEGGTGKAGDLPGHHTIEEIEISLEELAQILGEELELPRIEPKGKKDIKSQKDKYTGISRSGPESLRHFKRTYKEALKRQIAAGDYDFEKPKIVPIKRDMRYRSKKTVFIPDSSALIIYIMDVSGSMGPEQKEIVRLESFWIDTWLRFQYERTEFCYIVHDVYAKEVDYETFFHIGEGGGTKISSALRFVDEEIIDKKFPSDDWNIYIFQFSDGDNWDDKDTAECVSLLKTKLLAKLNLYCYGQVKSSYKGGGFIRVLEEAFKNEPKVTLSKIASKDDIYGSIKHFLGKGR